MTTQETTTQSMHRGGFQRREYRPDQVKPRSIHFEFPHDIPRFYVGGSPVKTHIMNGLNLFVPHFERMMVRLFRSHIIPRLRDPRLIEQARGFMLQEGSHAKAHTQYFENLRSLGYDIDGFLRLVQWLLGERFEGRLGPKLALSAVAAFEHYTDVMVLLILQGDFLEGCDPRMRELFAWHVAEEIEHNAVAYEMLRQIDDGQALRMAGNVLGLVTLFGLTLMGMAELLRQDGKLFTRETARELRDIFFTKHRLLPDVVELFKHYARRDYHPNDADYSPLARAVLDPDDAPVSSIRRAA